VRVTSAARTALLEKVTGLRFENVTVGGRTVSPPE